MNDFKKAILVIHGFSSGLSDNEFLVNQLQLHPDFDVFAWTLPGHDKKIINKVKYTDWIDAVDIQIRYLLKNKYKEIYVVGHSMGGLLSGYLASQYPQIKKVVFLSAGYDFFSKDQYKEDLKKLKGLKDTDAGYKSFFRKLTRVPISTAIELKKLIKEYRPHIKQVKQETLVLHGDKDEVVPYKAMKYIKENIKSENVTYTTVKDGRHVLLRGKKKQRVINYIEAFLIGGKKWEIMKKSEL